SAPSTAPLPGKRGDAAKSDARRIGDAGEVIVYLQSQSFHMETLLDPETNRTLHLCEIKQARHQKGVGWPESLRWCNCPCQRQQGHHGLIHNVTYQIRY
ncbi:hypothetical protein, partial [Propionivibrio sp.]|uniref:hypothetical protein n=1 Tax=Propionivibrio sp. TaxID=2212460 RepID=UPI003BF07E29